MGTNRQGLHLDGFDEWVKRGNSLRNLAGLESAKGSSRSSILNCVDARVVVDDKAREDLQREARRYCASKEIMSKRWNRLTIPGGGARASKRLFPTDYRRVREELLFAAEHQFANDAEPCSVILLTHFGCGMLELHHKGLSFQDAVAETFEAAEEIAQEMDDLQRGANVLVIADGLIGNENVPRYLPCGLVLSQTRISSLPTQDTSELLRRAVEDLHHPMG